MWTYENGAVRDEHGRCVCVPASSPVVAGDGEGLDAAESEIDERGRLIVACVNALEGLNPAAVPGLVSALEGVVRDADGNHAPVDGDWLIPVESVDAARSALAKARQS